MLLGKAVGGPSRPALPKSPLTDEELSLTDDIRGWESTPPW